MLLYDEKDELVMGAELGLSIPAQLNPYSCLPLGTGEVEEGVSKCLEWKDHARLREVVIVIQKSPHLRTPNPGFNPEFTPPPFYITNAGGYPQLNPGFEVLTYGTCTSFSFIFSRNILL
jgi:hypothetical protein